MIVTLVLIGTGLLATESRMTALGNPYGFIRDDTDIFIYPGAMHSYNKTIIAEMNNSSSKADWTLGATLPILNYKLGIYMNRATGVDIDDYLTVNNFDHSDYLAGELDIAKKVEFLFGFMDNFAVGFGTAVDYMTDPVYYTVPPSTEVKVKYLNKSASHYTLFGGMSNQKLDLGARINLSGAVVENEYSKEETAAAIMDIILNGRYYVVDNDALALMAKGGFALSSSVIEYTPVQPANSTIKSREETESAMMLDTGIGANFKVTDHSTVILGLTPVALYSRSLETPTYPTIPDSTYTDTYKMSYFLFPAYNIGVESQICSWLKGRIGAKQSYRHYSMEDEERMWPSVPVYDPTWYSKSFDINLGLAFKFGKFCVDAVVVQDLLFQGPNFIGGDSQGLASKVSVTYTH